METTIRKTVKGKTMETIFENSNTLNIKYFKALNLERGADYNPDTNYKYEITIRHADGKDVNVLFEEERFKVEFLNTELQALQNAGNNVGLVIHEKYQEDKRRTVNKYFATLDGISISPVLDYENLNYFILGYIKASTIINKQINSVC